jgi:DNA repair exonuclease SbcCD nuclease subunit
MSYRLLHLADLHLDRAFAAMGCHGELARRRRQGLRDSLQRMGPLARELRCEAVTIGGDLYEHERAGFDTGRFLAETFAAWRPLRVFISPGNHDPLLPASLYRVTEWPANVHIFSGAVLEPVTLEEGLQLWGLAHRDPAWAGNPFDGAGPAPGSGVNLALFHGAELGWRPAGKSIHGPFRRDQIRDSGFAAALCGHYHGRRLDAASGLLYPGSPEPLAYDETGGRGPVLVEVAAGGAVTFSAVDTNRWTASTVVCDVSDCTSPAAVLDRAAEVCAAAGVTTATPSRTMVRIDLQGDVEAGMSLDLAGLEAVLRERLELAAVSVRDQTAARLDLDAIASELSARGAFVRTARAAIDGAGDEEEADTLRDALRYGLAALSGHEVGLR